MDHRVDGEVLRSIMRHVPSPVTVVTVADRDEIRGITIGSFTSASLHPPLISFNINREAQAYEALTAGDRFAVHVLSDSHARLSDHFATPDLTSEEQFEGIPYRVDPDGTPILLDALILLRCRRYAVYEAGDHSIVVGLVLSIDSDADGSPMIYFNRTYRSIGAEVQPTLYEPVGDEPGKPRE